MDAKTAAVIRQLIDDNRAMAARIERLEKVKPVAAVNGRDGKDGPDLETVVKAVLAQVPGPKDVDTKALVNEVLAQIPKPRDGKDGRDGQTVSVSDVAAIVLAKIPKPRDGKDGPDLETVVRKVRAQVQNGRDGEPGPQGPKGEPGNDGVSVTDVRLDNNELFVYLDGKKKRAGKIKLPAITAPFSPGNAGGGGVLKTPPDAIRGGLADYNDTATATAPIAVPGGFVDVDLTNDALGEFTNREFLPKGVADIWDAETQTFDFSSLPLGTMVDIRLDLTGVTTSPNQVIQADLVLGLGSGFEYSIPWIRNNVRDSGSAYEGNRYNGIYIGNELTRNNPAKFVIRSSDPIPITVNGWYCKILIRGF